MAKCDICEKKTVFGNSVSHSIRRTSRPWKVNVRKVHVIDGNVPKTLNVCSRCLRSNKVTRAM